MTSHDVVAKVRKLTRIKRVGHAGTLDPLAEGVLPVALGPACRLVDYLPSGKQYLAAILLGRTTATDDLEGEVLEERALPYLDEDEIRSCVMRFEGNLSQTPPLYSAIRLDGKRLYQLARSGAKDVVIKPRDVTVYKIEIVKIELPTITVRVACSKGTYIRSLARDIGAELAVGGCLQKLLREKAGLMTVEKSVRLAEVEEAIKDKRLEELIVSPADALAVGTLNVDDATARKLSHGQKVDFPGLEHDSRYSTTPECPDLAHGPRERVVQSDDASSVQEPVEDRLVMVAYHGHPLALCRCTWDDKLEPEVVFADQAVR